MFSSILSKFLEHLFSRTSWTTGFRICPETKVWNCILGELQICRLLLFLSLIRLRAESDPTIYGNKHLFKNVEKMKERITLSMLAFQRQYFEDLDVFILCFDFFGATNIDLLCILLLSIDCSLNAIKTSYIIHSHSKTTVLKLSKLKELQCRVLELFCYLRTWSTQKANALSRQRLIVYNWIYLAI